MAVIDVRAEISGSVWKIQASVGDQVLEDEPILILESMKMEIPLAAPENGKVIEILASEGATVSDGEVICRLEI